MRRSSVQLMWAMLCGVLALNTQASMVTPGQFSVSESGAATYSIPIQVPPGIAGMEPKLSINYSSQGGNGLMGVGWGLSGLSAISRCPRTIAQDGVHGAINYNTDDRFCMDGQRLMVVGGTYGAANSEYRTEIESFSKVVAYSAAGNGPQWFKVWTKAGLIMEYGNTVDSRLEANANAGASVRTWSVNKISDTKGNYIAFSYTKDTLTGSQVPSRIDYTGNGVQLPTASVRFVYDWHPDMGVPAYFAGNLIQNTKRLTTVQTFVGETLSKEYRATYTTSALSGHSRLVALSECAMPDNVCKPMQVFSAVGLVNETFGASAQLLAAASDDFVDVNGDGRADSIRFGTDGIYAGLSTSTGMNTQTRWINAFGTGLGYSNRDATPILFQDVNGDGLPDVVAFTTSDVQVAKSNGVNGFNTQTSWLAAAFGSSAAAGSWTNQTTYPRTLADVNGDGRVDIVGFKTNGVYVSLNTGSGFTTPSATPWITSFGTTTSPAYTSNTTYPRFAQDINGDGLADLIGFAANGVWVSLSNGSSFDAPVQWLANQFGYSTTGTTGAWTSQDAAPRTLADINGDGLLDIVGFKNNAIYYSLNTGRAVTGTDAKYAGFTTPVVLTTLTGWTGYTTNAATPRFVADVNGDGKADLVGFSSSGGVQVALSNGSGFATATQWRADFGTGNGYTSGSVRQLVDVDGDGFPDVVGVKSGLTNTAKSGRTGMPDWVLAITNNSLNTIASITYKPLTDSTVYTKGTGAIAPVMDLQFPMYVVSSVQSPNGQGGNLTTNFKYGQLRAESQGRGMLGFGWQQTTQLETSVTVRTDNRQDFPYVGMPYQVKKTLPGYGNGGTLSLSISDYACLNPQTSVACTSGTGNRYFPYTLLTSEVSWDGNGAALPTVSTGQNYDNYGNVTQVTVGSSDGFSKTTTNTYTNDTANWFLGRLVRSKVESSADAGGVSSAAPGFVYLLDITANTVNFNLKNAAIAAGWGGVVPLLANVTISSGVVISSATTSTAAFATGSDFPIGSVIHIINNGVIAGRGGAGGKGTVGEGGGAGLNAQTNITVANYGTIQGGGGGGGGSLTKYGVPITNVQGGCGAGVLSAPPVQCTQSLSVGTTGSVVSGPSSGMPLSAGGIGGGPGMDGYVGVFIFPPFYPGSAGGAGGPALVGNSNVTWISTGTRLGAVQ